MANKKVKLNDKVNVKKNKKGVDIDKYVSDEAKEVRRFIIILLSIIILVLGVYAITRFVNKNKDSKKEENVTAGAIDYDKVSVGTMLNKSDEEYYVIVYDGEDNKAVYYSAIVTTYMQKDKSLPVYFCDLGNRFNKDYYVGENGTSNKNAKTVEEFAFGKLTLIKVKMVKLINILNHLTQLKKN